MARAKMRLDRLLVERDLASTRTRAQAIILAGEVRVNGQRVDKPGTAVPVDAEVQVMAPLPYVSRGGFKLAAAVAAFDLQLDGLVCADVGACTGGFTDVLLQYGAARVYAIDVGYGQLDWRLRQDPRVQVMERTNARHLETLPEPVALAVIDVSFISLRLILPAVRQWLSASGQIVALVKPQFEAGPEQVGKGGIVRQAAVHRQVLSDLLAWATAAGYGPRDAIPSPIQGAAGNVEFLIWLQPGSAAVATLELVDRALAG